MRNKDEIEWRDPYADFNKPTDNKRNSNNIAATLSVNNTTDNIRKVTYNDDTPTYTAKDIYEALKGSSGEKKTKVSISASLSVYDKDDMEHPVSKGEVAFGNSVIDLQRREDTIQIKIDPPMVENAELKVFWNLLETYGEITEQLYEEENKLVMLFMYFIPMDKPYMFMEITNPLFWALHTSKYDGGNQQIRILVPSQMVEFSVSNVDQSVLEKEVDAEIDAETNRLIMESTVLEKEIAKLEEQITTEETMEAFSDKEENEEDDDDSEDE